MIFTKIFFLPFKYIKTMVIQLFRVRVQVKKNEKQQIK